MKNNVKEEIAELFSLCVRVNETKEYNAFFDYSGHVDLISIRITEKYDDSKREQINILSNNIYIDGVLFSEEKFRKEINELKAKILALLNPNIEINVQQQTTNMNFRDLIKRVKKVDLLHKKIQQLERKNKELTKNIYLVFKCIDSLEESIKTYENLNEIYKTN